MNDSVLRRNFVSVISTREVQTFYGILHHNVRAPLELLEMLSMTFQRFYLKQHSIQIQTESDSESKVLHPTAKRLGLQSDVNFQ